MALAAQSPVGAKNLLFNPSLAGGSSLEPSPHLRGAFVGLDLGHTRADMIRATLEGIALNMRLALDELRRLGNVAPEMIAVGGASRSGLWRQIFADALESTSSSRTWVRRPVPWALRRSQAVGCGLWQDFTPVDRAHHIESVQTPDPRNVQRTAGSCQSSENSVTLWPRSAKRWPTSEARRLFRCIPGLARGSIKGVAGRCWGTRDLRIHYRAT